MNINLKKWLSTFLIFVVVMAQSLVPTIAKAQELNAMGFVDSFNIEKTDLYYGERTKINVNFSEKDGYKLQPGDVLTLTLPPELKGFNGKIPLDDYGVCEVSAGVAKCIFNEKVSTRNNIRGFFTINVQATNVETDQKKEIQTNLGTTLEMQKVTITGPSSGGGSGENHKGPFSYKAGDIQPDNTDEVRWFLMVNYNKEVLKADIKLSDSLQEGQKFKKDSFSISVDNAAGQKSLSLKDFESQGYGTIEFVNDMTFKAIFNKDKASGTRFSISYKADITEAGKKIKKLENKYAIEYQVADNEPVSDSQVAQVENITAEGGAEGDLNATTSIAGTKTWKGDKVNDRPKAIKVDLIQNGKVIETKEVTETSDWKYEFENLRVFDSEGKAYKYEVKEQPVSGYQSKVNGYDITNVKIHEGKEETLEENWETTEELEEQPKPEKPEIKEEENHLETPKEEKPKVEGEGKEETLEENWETTEELEDQPKPEKPGITEEENHLETPKEEKPEITEEENHLANPKEENPEVKEEIKPSENPKEENPEVKEEVKPSENPKEENPEVKEEVKPSENAKEERQTPEKSEGAGKQLPQTGGHKAYEPFLGGALIVFGLLMLVMNKRRYN
ncbi:Cna B-type domain-containing protein [Bacillus cereus]|uniref:Cna B-type domain-containing protein n=1 Tax=Bacillus cereus TaxID=1396 RepID=UPI00159B8561|nr:Cna B-type domain-containing protein [Bacillus cereus]